MSVKYAVEKEKDHKKWWWLQDFTVVFESHTWFLAWFGMICILLVTFVADAAVMEDKWERE